MALNKCYGIVGLCGGEYVALRYAGDKALGRTVLRPSKMHYANLPEGR